MKILKGKLAKNELSRANLFINVDLMFDIYTEEMSVKIGYTPIRLIAITKFKTSKFRYCEAFFVSLKKKKNGNSLWERSSCMMDQASNKTYLLFCYYLGLKFDGLLSLLQFSCALHDST